MKSVAVLLLALLLPAALSGSAPRYYPDDPLMREPETQDASRAQPREILLAWETLDNLFGKPGDLADVPAMDVNTVDEIPDSSWFTNRGPLTPTLVARGPDVTAGPAEGSWTVISGKSDGITPGFTIRDTAGTRWFIKFDPPEYPELATGAEIVSTKLLWALGYNVPENHIAVLVPDRLHIAPSATMKDEHGRTQRLTMTDVYRLLSRGARKSDGTYRVLASRALDGKPIGGFLYFGTRSDDPNDLIPHEHRRSLRALRVFGAWLNHVDAKAINTLDTVVNVGRGIVRHHLLDFGSTLGSAGIGPHEFEEGHEYLYSGARPLVNAALLLGFHPPSYRHIHYHAPPAVGRFDMTAFDPVTWKPRIPNAAFNHARPEDLFWAATKLAGIDVPTIEAAVRSARYGDPKAERYLIEALVRRRQRILETYLTATNPIVNPSLTRGGELRFENAAVAADVSTISPGYETDWYSYDNDRDVASLIGAAACAETHVVAPTALPSSAGSFVRIDVRATTRAPATWRRPVTLVFRRADDGWHLVGLDRNVNPLSLENPRASSDSNGHH